MAENAAPPSTSTPSCSPSPSFRVSIKHWRAVASWTWDAGDEVCGICRAAFDGCPPEAKFPGDDAPVVWGACGHAFHLQCISRWLGAPAAEQRCPFCRRPWEYKSAGGGGVEEGAEEEAGGGGAGDAAAVATTTATATGRRPPPPAAGGGGGGAARTTRRARTTAGASPPAVPPVPAP